jgi:hypothetical protein
MAGNNSDQFQMKELKPILNVLQQDIQVRQNEIEVRKMDITSRTDIQTKTIDFNDRENQRQLDAFRIQCDQDHLIKIKKLDFVHRISYLVFGFTVLLVITGLILVWNDKPIGMEILKLALTALLSGAGGYGIGKGQANKSIEDNK